MSTRIFTVLGLLISWSLCTIAAERAEEIALPAVTSIQKQLISAAKAGDADRIKELIAQGALIVESDSPRLSDLTAFEWAALKGHPECCNLLLDELENNTPLDAKGRGYTNRHQNYRTLQEVKQHRNLFVPLFQQDLRRTSLAKLRLLIETIKLRSYLAQLYRLVDKLEDQYSLNTVLSHFSSDNPQFRLALVSAGAEYVTDSHFSDKQKHLDRLLRLAVAEENKELLEALIRTNTSIDSLHEALCLAATRDMVPMAKILLTAGAPINYKSKSARASTPYFEAFNNNALCMGQFLFESGASIQHHFLSPSYYLERRYFETLMRGSVRRYAPTKNDAKIAMQNIARLIYALNHLPAYVIYEIILFAAGEQNDDQGQALAPEWTKALKNSLAVLYLYKCNGNKLFPLWEQTMRCLEKDPQRQALLISKLENFIRPFLANDVIKIACLYLMERVAEDAGPQHKGEYTNALCDDFEFYYNHLKDGPLNVDGFDTP